MAQNFIESQCGQGFLLPPDVREWLAADHLAWFLIDAVRAMDLAAFYGAYRADGHGRAAYEPSMMVTLLMYAYATKQRSSRAIESHCRQDVAYRVITGNVVPDHATIARFVVRHEVALAGLFGEVLGLCGKAGLVAPGLVAIDGTRLAGNASRDANREFEQIAREILAEAKAIDEAEDQLYGQARGDELPEQLRTPEGRREFLRKVKHERQGPQTDTQAPEPETETRAAADGEFEFDCERIVARVQGREVIANQHVQVLIPPDSGTRETPRPGWTGGRYTWMRYVLASELGERLYRKRKQMIEPVFGHTKHNRGVTRFHRRGRTAVRTEWRLLMATHNLTKLYRHQIATAGA
jgi:transposase